MSAAGAARAGAIGEAPGWSGLALGLLLCGAIMVAAEALGARVPMVGAPLFAIAIGVALANSLVPPAQLRRFQVGAIGRNALKLGIVLLGASLDLGDIVRTGLASIPLLVVTMGAGLATALLLGRALGVDWRMRCLIGIGTTICGGSAIAALSPVIRARAEEIAYSISVIFFFNMLAVFSFPLIGHLLHLGDHGFGLWAGTAINDTSAVVAAGFSYSHAAGTQATIVKLTRTTLIIPAVLGFGIAMPWLDPAEAGRDVPLARRVLAAVPGFILLFVLASVLQSLGWLGHAAPRVQEAGRLVMVLALAAIGLQGNWRCFAGAGPRPLLLGLGCWIAVACSSLTVQALTGML
jgi:uncharacterized integral membrane protein (TIGR00698 family)